MQIVPPDKNGIAIALKVLREGGVVAHATETCYGLACDLSNLSAVTKMFAIKKRPAAQPVSALFYNVHQAKEYVEWNSEADTLAKKHLPGPLTIILPRKTGAPAALHVSLPTHPQSEPAPTIGVRISSHPLAQELVRQFRHPLSTTSANLHGEANPYSADEIVRQFSLEQEQPDLILDSGTLPRNPPSTIINLAEDGDDIVRKGDVRV